MGWDLSFMGEIVKRFKIEFLESGFRLNASKMICDNYENIETIKSVSKVEHLKFNERVGI